MPELKTYDVFISHAWTYNSDYYRLVEMLNKAPNFKWRNYSVPEHDPLKPKSKKDLKEALKRQMRPANIIIILAGMYATHSDWIEFEIDYAEELNKPMIGVKPWGQQRIPKVVQDAVKEMVGWNTSSIVRAIRKWSL